MVFAPIPVVAVVVIAVAYVSMPSRRQASWGGFTFAIIVCEVPPGTTGLLIAYCGSDNLAANADADADADEFMEHLAAAPADVDVDDDDDVDNDASVFFSFVVDTDFDLVPAIASAYAEHLLWFLWTVIRIPMTICFIRV